MIKEGTKLTEGPLLCGLWAIVARHTSKEQLMKMSRECCRSVSTTYVIGRSVKSLLF